MFRLLTCFLMWMGVAFASFAQDPIPLPDNPVPDYPERARFGLVTGDVRFRAYVTEEGTVQGVEITRVPAPEMGFEDAVVPVVKKWRFEPARVGATPIGKWFEGSVRFSLKPEEEDRIYGLNERAVVAWNRGNAQVLASLFSDKAHIHTVTEDPAFGPQQIRIRFSELLGTTFKGARLTLSVDMIRFFDENRAEVEHTYQLSGSVENIGRLGTTLTRVDGEWLVDHARLIEGSSVLWDTDPLVDYRPPEPALPPEARANNVAGKVVLEILVRRDGSTEVVKVLESLPHGCTEAAIENARQWRWKPASRKGTPVEATGTIVLGFGEERPGS